MFTGLIQALGHATFIDPYHLQIRYLTHASFGADTQPGDSIAVDGICLTVEYCDGEGFVAATSPETLDRTTLNLTGEQVVNLESSLRVGGKIGGHFVSGHIDGVGYLHHAELLDPFWNLTFRLPPASPVARYLVSKGSIAINGISLTVAYCDDHIGGDRGFEESPSSTFTVAVIPVTYQETNLQHLKPGDPVNLEGDLLAKYVEKLLRYPGVIAPSTPEIDLAFLTAHGYA
jgi:riboflavin synthase